MKNESTKKIIHSIVDNVEELASLGIYRMKPTGPYQTETLLSL